VFVDERRLQRSPYGSRVGESDLPSRVRKRSGSCHDPVWYYARMRIRRAAATDADAVANVFLAAKAEMTYLPELHTEDETKRWIRDVVLCDLQVWVADDGERIIGFAALSGGLVEHLYVHPQKQNRGVGTALLGLSKHRRPGGLQLWVFQKNVGARRFYERHGFTLVQLTDGHDNEEREPDALYEWSP
jgi:GNAT superfamily N-acetyltransferase